MNATELESAIVSAEKDPSRIRALIADFRAYKDSQLSDLTGQVNMRIAEAAASADAAAHSKGLLTSATEQNAALQEQNAALQRQNADLAAVNAAGAAENAGQKATIEALMGELSAAEGRIAALQAEVQQLTATAAAYGEKLTQLQAKAGGWLAQARAAMASQDPLPALHALLDDIQSPEIAAAKARLAEAQAALAGMGVPVAVAVGATVLPEEK